MTAKLGSRWPILSRKIKSRKEQRNPSFPDSLPESLASRSRASSIRAPSIIEKRASSTDRRDVQTLPTPSQSFTIDSSQDAPSSPATAAHDDGDEVEASKDCEDEEAAPGPDRTPLLPPVLSMLRTEESIASPLQSPKIVESPSVVHSPYDSPLVHSGLPSPPLSTKPSISSFHHRQIVPSSEIPPFLLAEPQDEWALKLGHANFKIQPEPYIPQLPASLSVCKKLRSDWDEARQNYGKHLLRTEEHYSATSKVYQLTEEKWAAVDATWKRNHEQALATVATLPQQLDVSAEPASLQAPSTPVKIPPISGPASEGKFPKVGDLDIVGPMEQAKPMVMQRPSRKRAFWKFFQGMLPSGVAFGRSQA